MFDEERQECTLVSLNRIYWDYIADFKVSLEQHSR